MNAGALEFCSHHIFTPLFFLIHLICDQPHVKTAYRMTVQTLMFNEYYTSWQTI